MTERAKRACEELRKRGWQIDDTSDDVKLARECHVCRTQLLNESRFCHRCGSKVSETFDSSSIDDLEAAIAAALQET